MRHHVEQEPVISSPNAEPDLSGYTLDRYLLRRRLGVGGMGAVYEAEHTLLRKRFAMKLLRHELACNDIHRRRFLREARAASAITNPNVVTISDFGETHQGHVYFVMELLQGHDLADLLQRESKLEWTRARDILLQVASALEAAHAQGIVHRDIKPSNVFLTNTLLPGKSEIVKVLDFGIAKWTNVTGEPTAKLTSTDEIFGTVSYMAPEMAMGNNADHRSDIYALGVMMYRMLTGELPFTEGNAFQILSQHINAAVPPPRDKDPCLTVGVEAIILKALEKDPDLRFQSMEEVVGALTRGAPLQRDTATALLPGVKVSEKADATQVLTELQPPVPSIRVCPRPMEPPLFPNRTLVGEGLSPPRTEMARIPVRSELEGVSTDRARAVGVTRAQSRARPDSDRTITLMMLLVLGVFAFLAAIVLGLYVAQAPAPL